MKVVGLIPAHLASMRFPRKILFPFRDVPMIEHVRRRALMAEGLDEVYVATCDEEIATTVASSGGNVIMTANTHMNGTNRCAEAAETLDCTHILLLQGDEPLLLPRHISAMIAAMRANPEGDAWNATAPINDADELDRHSFVKCALGVQERINFCFRRSPSIAPFDAQQTAIRKILGMIGFRRDYLMKIAGQPATTFEKTESIEQMRIVETGGFLTSVPVDESLPSVNEPAEAQHVLDYLQKSEEQAQLLRRVLAW